VDIYWWIMRGSLVGAMIYTYLILDFGIIISIIGGVGAWIVCLIVSMLVEKSGRRFGWWADAGHYDKWVRKHGERP